MEEYINQYKKECSYSKRLRYGYWSLGCAIEFPLTQRLLAMKDLWNQDLKVKNIPEFDVYKVESTPDWWESTCRFDQARSGTSQGAVITRKHVPNFNSGSFTDTKPKKNTYGPGNRIDGNIL